MGLFCGYILCINTITFVIYALDKIKAKAGAWRISEFVLILLAVIGGSAGALGYPGGSHGSAGDRRIHPLPQKLSGVSV